MTTFFDAWIASESAAYDSILLKKIYIDINGGHLHAGILFSQIMYWHGYSAETGKPRLVIFRDGHYWLAKRYEDWYLECRVNANTAKAEIAKMIKRGLLIKALYKFDGLPTVHIRVNPVEFEARVQFVRDAIANGMDMTYLTGKLSGIQPLTETTSETPPETTEESIVASANATATDDDNLDYNTFGQGSEIDLSEGEIIHATDQGIEIGSEMIDLSQPTESLEESPKEKGSAAGDDDWHKVPSPRREIDVTLERRPTRPPMPDSDIDRAVDHYNELMDAVVDDPPELAARYGRASLPELPTKNWQWAAEIQYLNTDAVRWHISDALNALCGVKRGRLSLTANGVGFICPKCAAAAKTAANAPGRRAADQPQRAKPSRARKGPSGEDSGQSGESGPKASKPRKPRKPQPTDAIFDELVCFFASRKQATLKETPTPEDRTAYNWRATQAMWGPKDDKERCEGIIAYEIKRQQVDPDDMLDEWFVRLAADVRVFAINYRKYYPGQELLDCAKMLEKWHDFRTAQDLAAKPQVEADPWIEDPDLPGVMIRQSELNNRQRRREMENQT